MTTPQQPPNLTNVRGLGWDIDSPFSSNRGDLLPVGSFGHTGFTGTSLWIDPTTNTYIILLTNAVHMKDGNVIALRTEVATAVAAALQLTAQRRAEDAGVAHHRLQRSCGRQPARGGAQWAGARPASTCWSNATSTRCEFPAYLCRESDW